MRGKETGRLKKANGSDRKKAANFADGGMKWPCFIFQAYRRAHLRCSSRIEEIAAERLAVAS